MHDKSKTANDDEVMMDHIALECMHAIESKDKEMFRDCFHTLVSDIIMKLSEDMKSPEMDEE